MNQNFSLRRFLTCLVVICCGLTSALGLLAAPELAAQEGKGGRSFFSSLSGGASKDFLPVDEAFVFSSSSDAGVLQLRWKIADGYYLYKDRLKVRFEQPGVVQEEARYSQIAEVQDDPYFGRVEVFRGDLLVEIPIISTGGATELTAKVSYQGCADAGLCYPPQHRDTLYYPGGNPDGSASETTNAADTGGTTSGSATDSGGSNTESAGPADSSFAPGAAQSLAGRIQSASLWQSLGLFLLAGIGLAFTPCVFPMIPILSSIIAGQRQATAGGSFKLSLAYVLGMAFLYGLLGMLMGSLGAGFNLQAYLQNPWALGIFSALFVLLALSMFGLYELQLPAFLRDRLNNAQQKQRGGTLAGVFAMGSLSALVVSPCVSAPLAGALLYIAATGDAPLGAMLLFTMALGMGLPLLAIGTGAGRLLPRAGAWMVAVKAVFGVLLLAVAIWLLERFMAGPVTLTLWALLAGVSAVCLGAFEPAPQMPGRLRKGLGLMLFAYGIVLLVGASAGAHDPLRPLAPLSAGRDGPGQAPLAFTRVRNLPQLAQQVELAAQRGQPVLVDFYADWCISCKIMDRDVFPDPEVRQLLSGYHLVKADVTANDPGNQALLAEFGLFGPPGTLFYSHQGREIQEARIYGEISKQDFIRHLRRLESLVRP